MDAFPGGVVDVPGPWEHRWIAANGARFHVAELGAGPLVVFLHGFPEFWWAWRHQAPALAAAGCHSVAMDLRGYGGSDKTPRGYDPVTLAGDVAGLVRSLGAQDAVLVGHGWGGYVAWAATTLHPRHVRALAVVSAAHPLALRRLVVDGVVSGGGARHRPPVERRRLDAVRHLLGHQVPLFPERRLAARGALRVERLLRRWTPPGSTFPDSEAARRYRAAMRLWPAPHCALESHRWLVRSALRQDGRRFARRMRAPIEVPVLQLHGALDPAIPPVTAERSAAFAAGPYRWRLIDGVGHFPHEEAPDDVTKELLDWLR